MTTDHPGDRSAMSRPFDDYSALGQLRLTPNEFDALCSQGFVSAEQRRGTLIFKLRFRCGHRQYVRYIGSDPQQAQAVEAELAGLQRRRRLQRQLATVARAARRKLREMKQQLTPMLDACGYHFHGRAIRKRRGTNRSS